MTFLGEEMFVGSPLPSGNKVGKAIVAKNGVLYSFKGLIFVACYSLWIASFTYLQYCGKQYLLDFVQGQDLK